MHYPVVPQIKQSQEGLDIELDVDVDLDLTVGAEDKIDENQIQEITPDVDSEPGGGEDLDADVNNRTTTPGSSRSKSKSKSRVASKVIKEKPRFIKYVKLHAVHKRNDSVLEITEREPLESIGSNSKKLLGTALNRKLKFEKLITRSTQTEWKWVTMAMRWRHAKLITPTWMPDKRKATVIIRISEFPAADRISQNTETEHSIEGEEGSLSEAGSTKGISKTKENTTPSESVSPAGDQTQEAQKTKVAKQVHVTLGHKHHKTISRKVKVVRADPVPVGLKPPKTKKDKCVDTSDLCFDPDLVGVSLLQPIQQMADA